MANSKIKQILVGTTTYDIEDAGAAHLSVTNTFTGTNEFRGYAAQFLTRAAAANDPHITVGAHEIRCYSGEISNPVEDTFTSYSHGSITYRSTAGTYPNTLTLPSKAGTIALTSDIDVTAAGNNTFTGTNTFTQEPKFRSGILLGLTGVNPEGSPDLNDLWEISKEGFKAAGGSLSTQTIKFPDFSTFTTTNHTIPLNDTDNTFTGTNTFSSGNTKFTTLNNAENDPFISINDHEIACKTMIGTTSYQYNEIIHKGNEIFLPSKSGAIALTDDIDVTAAGNNTFTGTNTFKVADKNNSIKIEPTGISIYSQVGPVGSVPGVVLCSDHPDILKIKSTSSAGFIQFPELRLASAQGETVALRSDIPIKTATLSGTTLSITLS